MMKHVDRWRPVSTLLPTGCAACSAPCSPTTARNSPARAAARQAQTFLDTVQTCAPPIAVGVGLCIAPPPHDGYGQHGRSGKPLRTQRPALLEVSEDTAGGAGAAILLVMVAVAVALFIANGMKLNAFDYLEKDDFDLAYGVEAIILRKQEAEQPSISRTITTMARQYTLPGHSSFHSISRIPSSYIRRAAVYQRKHAQTRYPVFGAGGLLRETRRPAPRNREHDNRRPLSRHPWKSWRFMRPV